MSNSTFPPPELGAGATGIALHHHHDGTIFPSPYPTPDYSLSDCYFNCHFSSPQGFFEASDYQHHLHSLEVDCHKQPVMSITESANAFEHSNNSSCFSSAPFLPSQQPVFSQEITSTGSSAGSFDGFPPLDNQHHMQQESKRDEKRAKVERPEGHVIAFRIQTQLETLDDGFKWRKYGKKMVKSNPNPRHYYKCSIEGCKVKKIVERDGEDSSYLITTYDGKHNHESPACSVVYCDRLPFLMLRPSQSH